MGRLGIVFDLIAAETTNTKQLIRFKFNSHHFIPELITCLIDNITLRFYSTIG